MGELTAGPALAGPGHGPRSHTFGPFRLDTESLELRRYEERVRLEPLPARILLRLVERAGVMVTRRELRQLGWPAMPDAAQQSLNTCVRQIRHALNDDALEPQYVETYRSRGYRFIAPVAEPDQGHIEFPVTAKCRVVVDVANARADVADSRSLVAALADEFRAALSVVAPSHIEVYAGSADRCRATHRLVVSVRSVRAGSLRIVAQLVDNSIGIVSWGGATDAAMENIGAAAAGLVGDLAAGQRVPSRLTIERGAGRTAADQRANDPARDGKGRSISSGARPALVAAPRRRGWAMPVVALCLFGLAGPNGAAAQAVQREDPIETRSTGFVVRLGRDTLAVERITRTADRLEGELLRRIPATHVIRYSAALDDDGFPREFVFSITRPGVGLQPASVRGGRITFTSDSARVEIQRDSLDSRMVPAANAFPALPESYGLHELWLSLLRRSGQDSMVVTTVAPLGGPSGRMRVVTRGADSVVVPAFGGPLRLRAGRDGALLEVDGRATAVKNEVDRSAPIDIMALAEAYTRADSMDGALGTWISTRDTVNAAIDGASLWVDYGRPATRGRQVFGDGVLGDTLWRAGANAATQFRTDRDLLIGGTRVPAGTYTLWIHYDAGSATLIVNTQTGQWGTQYDRARDLVRIPLQVIQSDGAPVEHFTITVHATGGEGRGMLEFSWDRTTMSVDVHVIPS